MLESLSAIANRRLRMVTVQAGAGCAAEKVSGTFYRNGPPGASHKRFLTPFPRQKSRGFTLVEAITAMTIMGLIVATISALFFTFAQVWRRCSSHSKADLPARLAMLRVTKDLKNAYRVDEMDTDSITFTLPETDKDGYNRVPLRPGRTISCAPYLI